MVKSAAPIDTLMADKPAPPQATQSMTMMFVMIMGMIILFVGEIREALGRGMGFLLEPVIGFGGQFPVITILLAGAVPLIISILLRHFMVDWLAMGRMTEVNRALGKEVREAMSKRNMARVKKLQEVRMEVMKEFMPVQMAQMKPTVITMFLFIAVFSWLSIFVYDPSISPSFAVPWSANVSLRDLTVFPHWTLLYFLISLPLSLVLPRILKYLTFSRKLREMETG